MSIVFFFFLKDIISGKISYKEKIKELLDKKSRVFLPFWILAVFLCINAISLIFSKDLYFSFFGSPLRAGGFLNLVFYFFFSIFIFLFLKQKEWEKVWKFSFVVGLLVSLFALIQQFRIFGDKIIPYPIRPPSTLGSPVFLALYLAILSFLCLAFAIKEEKKSSRIFYFACFLIYMLVIFLTGTRAAYFGIFAGLIYFLFFYPKKHPWPKIAAGSILVFAVVLIYLFNVFSGFGFIKENPTLFSLSERFTARLFTTDPRPAGWSILLNAVKERPFFGWGLENISVAFDKYYDSGLPNIHKEGGAWWDRSHNIFLDIAVSTGIPALIIYLSLLGIIFYRLRHDKSLYAHGIKTSFIAYLATAFFSFDTFSTYLIFFVLIAFSLNILSSQKEPAKEKILLGYLSWPKYALIALLFLLIFIFAYQFNIKPLFLNREINIAVKNNCEEAVQKMDSVFYKKGFIQQYAGLEYVDMLAKCIKNNPKKEEELSRKAVSVLDDIVRIRPENTRGWLLSAEYSNILIQFSENKNELLEKSYSSLEKAQELSPKRKEIIIEWINWIRSAIALGDYNKAIEKTDELISKTNIPDFWWEKGIANIYSGNIEEGKENIRTAGENGYSIESPDSLKRILNAYASIPKSPEIYGQLKEIYKNLIVFEPDNFQYHASLAFVYKELKEYNKAREEANIVLRISPESEENIRKFLNSLK